MNKSPLLLTAGLLAFGLTVAGCGASEQQPATQTQQTQTAQTPAPATEAVADIYPIDWCIVSGEKLGSMGDPIPYTYKGRTVQLCCKGCIKAFDKTPDAFLARYDSAAAGLIMPPGDEHEHDGHDHDHDHDHSH